MLARNSPESIATENLKKKMHVWVLPELFATL